ARQLAGLEPGDVTVGAAELAKQLAPAQDLGVVDVAASRDREQPRVAGDRVEQRVVELGRAAALGGRAGGLAGRAILARAQARGDADVAVKGPRVLLAQARLVGLPAVATEHRRLRDRIPDVVGPARDPVAVDIVGVDEREDRRIRQRIKYTKDNQLWGHASRLQHVVGERAVAELE